MNLRQLVERGDRPFASPPQVGRYFPAAAIEDARRRLSRSIERGDGPGAVIGAAGMGKSLLLQVLATQYREKFDVVLLACAQLCTRRALLQAIHFELGLDYRRRDEGELRLSLIDQLLSGDEATQGLLLLVDEAQALAVHLLEELRLLTNLARGGTPRVRLVLAGLPTLEEKLAGPELQSFSQRLAARCYLTALSREETIQYVRAQLAASHVDADRLFVPPALEAVFTATDGVPRLVNQVCDRAFSMAEAQRLEKIDAKVVQAAWADLQQLPSAWEPPQSSSAHAPASSSSIEFGSLSDEPAVPSRPMTVVTAAHVSEEPTELDEVEDAIPSVAPTAPKAAAPENGSIQAMADFGLRIADYDRPQSAIRNSKSKIPDAVDPFAERFEEEELVLDSFATLARIFSPRTPRVENSRETTFARMVQDALDANDAAKTEQSLAPSEQSAFEPMRPTIRLAVVNDAPAPEPMEALVSTVAETTTCERAPTAVRASSVSDDASEAILVIEDEPAEVALPRPGVRRESYRQLFSRLRHGA